MPNNAKAKLNAPCRYLDEDGKIKYPAVDCAYVCETCGWNPAEAERRMKAGKRVAVVTRLEFPGRFSK